MLNLSCIYKINIIIYVNNVTYLLHIKYIISTSFMKSKALVITGDFFLSDPQISKEDKDWLYPQMI